MDKIPYSFNGHLINDGTVISWIPFDQVTTPTARAVVMERPQKAPIYAGKINEDKIIPLNLALMGASIGAQAGTVDGWFDPTDPVTHKFVVQDAANANKQWQIDATPISIPAWQGKQMTVTLETADPIYQSVIQGAGTILVTTTGQQGTITVSGNVNARPQIMVMPTQAGGSGWAYKRFIPIYNNTDVAFNNYPLILTGATFDTATLVSGGKMQADGDDLIWYCDGVQQPRWLNGMNSGTTSVWGDINLNRRVEMVSAGTVSAGGTITSIILANNKANAAALERLKTFTGGTGLMMWDSEILVFNKISLPMRKIYIQERASRGTTAAAHSVASKIRWIEHDIWLYYGNTTASAPDQDDTSKPVLDLTSTNLSWLYSVFADNAGAMAGGWIPSLRATDNKKDEDFASDYYTASRLATADPATEMGMTMQAFRDGNTWKAENAIIAWELYHPAGVTTVTVTGEKFRNTSVWPGATLKKSSDGSKWTLVWTETSPASASAWTALAAHSGIALGATYNWLHFTFNGSQPASNAAQADYSIQHMTLALDASKIPTIAFGGEQNNYHLQGTITNVTTGKAIVLNKGMLLNTTLTIDCDGKTVTGPDGTNARSALALDSTRLDWMELQPGPNVIQYDDPGTTGLTLTFAWRDRQID